jgi:carboxymethylenebutenolidase
MISQTEELVTRDGPMGIHVVRPDGDGPFPVVVFFHHGPGLDDGSKESMGWIADWGYYVVSHDRYHRERPWMTRDNMTEEEGKRFFDILLGTTDDAVDSDLEAVLGYLEGNPLAREAPMGCIGFCIGARSVLVTMARHNDLFKAGVGFHPSYTVTEDDDSPHLAIPDVEGSIYLGYGSEDTMQPASQQQPLIDIVQARDDGEVEIHDGADHGYSVPGGRYLESAADRSYAKAKAIFDRELR